MKVLRSRQKAFLFYGILPAIFALFLFETWPRLSSSFRKLCWLKPLRKSECVACLRKLNFDAVPYFPGFLDTTISVQDQEIVPLSGVPDKLTVFCKEGGNWEFFSSDPHGYSNPRAIWNLKKLDAVFLGDSYVLGECLPKDLRFAALAQSKIPGILNLGYSKSSLLSSYARFVEHAVARKPKRVFIFFAEENDPPELIVEASHSILSRYLSEPGFRQGLENLQPQLGKSVETQIETLLKEGAGEESLYVWKSLLQFENTRRLLGFPLAFAETPPALLQFETLTHSVLSALKSQTTSWNGTVAIVYLPSFSGRYRVVYPIVKTTAQKLGLDWLDAGDWFSSSKSPFTSQEPYHYTAAFNQVIANKILSNL